MTDKIKTPQDLISFLGLKESTKPLTTKAVTNRMFGLNGTFRDTGARLKHLQPALRDQSEDARSVQYELDYTKHDTARQLIKIDNFNNTKSELNQHKLRQIDDFILPSTG